MELPSKWDMICGDSLEVMKGIPDGAISAVVTDPPYGISEQTLRFSRGRSNVAQSNDFPPVIGDNKPFDPLPFLQYDIVALCGANNFASRLPDSRCWLIWDKKDGGTSDDNADCELIWTNQNKNARLFHHKWRGMIKASERNQKRVHPTQKPVELMIWIMDTLGIPKDALVLDPFAGSGTTGVACIKTGRRFLGIEISEEYCKIARRRITEEEQRYPLLAGLE